MGKTEAPMAVTMAYDMTKLKDMSKIKVMVKKYKVTNITDEIIHSIIRIDGSRSDEIVMRAREFMMLDDNVMKQINVQSHLRNLQLQGKIKIDEVQETIGEISSWEPSQRSFSKFDILQDNVLLS
jgi:hypothetical protein